APCATASGRSCRNARRLGAPHRTGARRRAEPTRARRAGAPPRRLPALCGGSREPSRDASGVCAFRRAAPCPHRSAAGDPGADADTRRLATAVVSGPPETTLRLSLGVATGELQGLFGTLPEPDTVNLAGLFFSRRPAGRSRRGLPLFEEDSYRRWARVAW